MQTLDFIILVYLIIGLIQTLGELLIHYVDYKRKPEKMDLWFIIFPIIWIHLYVNLYFKDALYIPEQSPYDNI